MTEQLTADVVVIGGGPGGYVTAIRGSQLGLKVVLVEREHLGGICLNWGCIPTKALLRASEINHLLHDLPAYGFAAKETSFDFKKVVQRSRDVSAKLTGGIGMLMKKNKITVVDGSGKLAGKGKVGVDSKDGKRTHEITAKHIILATGARARELPGLEADGKLVWNYKHALLPDAQPKKLLVIGSGAIGSEFASFYLNMGSEVTLVEVMDQILPVEDDEVSKFVQKQFEKQGMKVHVGTTVKELKRGKNDVTAVLVGKDGKTTEAKFDRVISAVGIVGNVEGLGLEGTKAKIEKTHVVVNEWGETGEEGVYAIGDLAGAPWLAHKASHEGVFCIEKIAGKAGKHGFKNDNVPGCTYCRPQVASVGLTEKAAKAQGLEIKVGRFAFIGNGKAIALGETDGFVKTIFNAKTGALVGAHMVGAEVTEMIQGYVIARQLEATEEDLMHTIFAHPTLSEMMHESVLDAYGKVIHM